jgi:hypothetical protein
MKTRDQYRLAYRIIRILIEQGDMTGRNLTESERDEEIPIAIHKAAVASRKAYRVAQMSDEEKRSVLR